MRPGSRRIFKIGNTGRNRGKNQRDHDHFKQIDKNFAEKIKGGKKGAAVEQVRRVWPNMIPKTTPRKAPRKICVLRDNFKRPMFYSAG